MVKILCVSDTVMPQMENPANLRRRYSDVDVIVSCGDMPSVYLEFMTSVLNVPLLYVRGNHDTGYDDRPPGGDDLHGRFVTYKGLSFFGLEGSIRYNDSPVQYTDVQMTREVLSAAPGFQWRTLRHGYGVDVFVAHSPAFGIHDMPDQPHTGFKAFLKLMQWFRPRYMVHGHVHTWDRRRQTRTHYHDTDILNINPVTVLDVTPMAWAEGVR